MRATGIVRRIDELGRVVIPKELRRTLRLREGEELEVSAEGDTLVLRKFSAVRELLPFAGDYALALQESTGFAVAVVDADSVVATAGDTRRLAPGDALSPSTRKVLEGRRTQRLDGDALRRWLGRPVEGSAVIAPILKNGDLHGATILFSDAPTTDAQVRFAETASRFFEKAL